jgi:addiction module RelB/DinJ family antitoxin
LLGVIINDTLTIRIDPALKSDFVQVVDAIGLDAPTAVRMFIKQTVQRRALPLSLSLAEMDERATTAFLDGIRADWGEW